MIAPCTHPRYARFVGTQDLGDGDVIHLWDCAACRSTVSGERPLDVQCAFCALPAVGVADVPLCPNHAADRIHAANVAIRAWDGRSESTSIPERT